MSNSLYGRDVISIQDLSLHEIQQILALAAKFKQQPQSDCLTHKIIAHCFFEPSTRTRLSFESATLRLGGQVLGFSSDSALSTKKGESLHDTMRVVSDMADLLIIRHPQEGSARLAADVSDKPVINAGDGANQHPVQALVDLFTIMECQQRIDGLSIALVGDLKYGRAIHSLAKALMLFNVRLFLVSPESLALPESTCEDLKKQGIRYSFHHSIEEIVPKVDIIYMSRLQQERFSADASYPQQYILTVDKLEKAKSNLKILHPLPRVNEIDMEVDQTEHAHYFAQAANGVCVRQALLSLILNKE